MDVRETAQIVAYVCDGDSRQGTPTRGTIQFWHDAIGDLDFFKCLAAVRAHVKESTEFVRPAHVRQRVVPARREPSFDFHSLPLGSPRELAGVDSREMAAGQDER